MNWNYIWMNLFGTTVWHGVNMGFWVSMGISLIVAVLMNLVFWSTKPYEK